MPRRNGDGVTMCSGCRLGSTCYIGITSERLDADDVLHFEATCPLDHQGMPGVAHGGWLTWLMDDVMSHLPMQLGHIPMTAKLEVTFVRPVPIGVRLTGEVWAEAIDGSKWSIASRLRGDSGDAALASGRGLWIIQDRTRRTPAGQIRDREE
jgi:acyl-coenzyme A thioesterase PaaI-like protein